MSTNPVNGAQGRVPLITSLAVSGAVFIQSLIVSAVSWLAILPVLATSTGGFSFGWGAAVLRCLALGVGVFVVLRWLLPVGATAIWSTVIRRSVVAAVGGAVVLFVVNLVAYVLPHSVMWQGGLFADSFPSAQVDTPGLGFALATTLTASIVALLELLPIAVLAGMFQKLWLQRALLSLGDSESAVAEPLDEPAHADRFGAQRD
jgi:hypothetical protein